MTYQEILKKLKSQANPKNVAGMARFGINAKNTLGVSIPNLRSLAKKIGKNLVLRPGWDMMRIPIMTELVWKKFSQHKELKQKLLNTGEAELIEGNWWGDCFFGVCRGVGQNNLGKILMSVREKLRKQNE